MTKLPAKSIEVVDDDPDAMENHLRLVIGGMQTELDHLRRELGHWQRRADRAEVECARWKETASAWRHEFMKLTVEKTRQ